tara:strand:- start:605 stop:1372 length:768 start_codon:yes stop_codon:yes gene_type:complete
VQVKCRNKVFEVYDISQAEEKSLQYTDKWRDASKDDWIVTADNKVLQVIGRRDYKKDRKKKVYLIRTGYGETPTYKPQIYARKQPDYEWDNRYKKNLVRNVKPTALQSAFIQQLVDFFEPDDRGMWKIPDIIDAYMSVYNDNNPSSSLRRAMAILRKDTVKEVMSSLMKDRLERIGVDDDYVAIQYKNFIEDIDAPASTRLQALNRVSDILGHVEKKENKTEQTVFMLSDGDKKLLAQHKKEIPDKALAKQLPAS